MVFHHLISRLNEEVSNTCKFSEIKNDPILQHIHKFYVFKYKHVHVPISNFRHFGIWKSMLYFVAIRNMLYFDIKFCNILRNSKCSNRNMSVSLFQTFPISKSLFSRFIFTVLIIFAKVIPLISLCLF